MEVSLFVTCLAESFYPRTAIATVKVLEHLGCKVHFPTAQTCCGQPLYNNGFSQEAAELARRMIRVFEDSRCVVTPSGSCAAMVREHFHELLKDDHAYEHGAQDLARKTFELVEFLVKVLKVDLRSHHARWKGKVTYHYSCHLRGIGMTDEAVQLMRQIDGLEYLPLEKMEQCCGFGGTFAVKYPEISGSMVKDKVECIRRTAADYVISNDSGCTMNIAGACHRLGHGVKFISLAEIIAESLGLLPREGVAPAERAASPTTVKA